MTQLVEEFLLEFRAAIDHFAHLSHVELPKHLISKEAARAFAEGTRGRDMR
jgi:hypothetical protein